jgi:hypothetical protein
MAPLRLVRAGSTPVRHSQHFVTHATKLPSRLTGRCHSHGRRVCAWCAGTTLAFPIEHAIWERVPFMRALAGIVGL